MTPFGINDDGRPVHRITIAGGGLRAAFLTRGAILQGLWTEGETRSLTVGAEELEPYFGPMIYHGALVGPVANRIAGARAEVGDVALACTPNDGENLLHGGRPGTWARVWEVTEHGPSHVLFRLDLAHMEDGFPGDRSITARYAINAEGVLRLDLRGATNRPTFLNVANHSYWNLDGAPNWEHHRLRVAARAYLPVDAALIPTGEIRDVAGTGFDFNTLRRPDLGAPGIDHCYVLSDRAVGLRDVLWFAASDGLRLTMATTEPGLQIYDGGSGLPAHAAPAFEAQGWPDAMHHPHFPQVTLRPGQVYATTTSWRFGRD